MINRNGPKERKKKIVGTERPKYSKFLIKELTRHFQTTKMEMQKKKNSKKTNKTIHITTKSHKQNIERKIHRQ